MGNSSDALCIYRFTYLVGNYFAIVMTFRYSARYLRNAISLIYHPDLVFLAGHFVSANADTCPASASCHRAIQSPTPVASPLTFSGHNGAPNCSHRITQVERELLLADKSSSSQPFSQCIIFHLSINVSTACFSTQLHCDNFFI